MVGAAQGDGVHALLSAVAQIGWVADDDVESALLENTWKGSWPGERAAVDQAIANRKGWRGMMA